MYIVQIYSLIYFVILESKSPSYIDGLAYYQLGGKHINIIVSATILNSTALIITLYRGYYPNATIEITGTGREKIKIIPILYISKFLLQDTRNIL